jgi:hypothetical protein
MRNVGCGLCLKCTGTLTWDLLLLSDLEKLEVECIALGRLMENRAVVLEYINLILCFLS